MFFYTSYTNILLCDLHLFVVWLLYVSTMDHSFECKSKRNKKKDDETEDDDDDEQKNIIVH